MAQHLDHHLATADERAFLEALVFLRGLYAVRGPRDRASVPSTQHMVAEVAQHAAAVRFATSR